MTELRQGRLASAVEWSDRVLNAIGPGSGRAVGATGEAAWKSSSLPCRANALFVRALALGRMGQLETARAALTEGDQSVRFLDKEYIWIHWQARDWVIADLLRREARALLEATPAATKPGP